MNHLQKLKQRVIDSKKQYQEGTITQHERFFQIALAQDKYFRATVADDFMDCCIEKYKVKIIEGVE